MFISFMQKENKTSNVEYEDDVINEVPSGQHNISIDPSQSMQLISLPGSQEQILVKFISAEATSNTSDSILIDNAVIFTHVFELSSFQFKHYTLCRFIHGFRLDYCHKYLILMGPFLAMWYCNLN